MASPVKLYQREMHDNLGYFATWLPGDPIDIGDIGTLEASRFRHASSLAELNIRSSTLVARSTQKIQYTSTKSTKVEFSAGASAADLAKGQVSIDFSSEGAFVFHASAVQAFRLENRTEVGQEILDLYEQGRWKKEWFVVEAVYAAEFATIIVSEEKSAGITLAANVEGEIPTTSLADPKIGLEVVSTRGRLVHIVGARELHPLYSCLRLRDPYFGAPSVNPVRGATHEVDESPFVRASINDLLDS